MVVCLCSSLKQHTRLNCLELKKFCLALFVFAMENHLDRPDNRRLSTGFKQLDGIIGLNNLNSGYFICLASRPGKGKSTFMLDLLLNLAISSGREILYITNEKTEKQTLFSYKHLHLHRNYSFLRWVKVNTFL